MERVYPVIFTKTKDEKDTVLIEVPDLGILTEGYGMANAIYMARDAIGLHGITKEDMGISITEASDIKILICQRQNLQTAARAVYHWLTLTLTSTGKRLIIKWFVKM